MIAGLKPLTDRLDRVHSRDEILEAHALYESSTQAYTPTKSYQDILGVVYRRLAEQWEIAVSWEECMVYGRSVEYWPVFADSVESLKYLKMFYKLVVLSNVDNISFAHSNAKLDIEFDAIYTAGDIGSYKPNQRNFDFMIENLEKNGIAKDKILHTAKSMFHDHQPANRAGLANCWIYRRYDKTGFGATMNPGDMPHYDFCFNSLAEFVEAHKKELGA
jgi:2-haloacid dehalogenase